MKKSILTLIAVLAALVPSTISAQGIGFEVDGIIYYNYSGMDVLIESHSDDCSGDLIIPETVVFDGRTYNVTTIGVMAFFYCSELTSVVIPNSVTTIESHAFDGCSGLANINIPNSVISIGEAAFAHCSCINSIRVEDGNPNFDSRNGCNAIIETGSNTLIAGCMNTVIPRTVTSIGDYTFFGSTALTSISIPNSVTSIGNGAFQDCKGLTSIDIPNSVTSIGNYAFYDCRGLTSIVCFAKTPPSTGDEVFYTWSSPDIYDNATLFVPNESLEAYQSHEEWGKFLHIVPFLGAGPGDINGDGNIAINDVTNLIDQLLSSDELPAYADVNGDGVVTIKDVTDLIDMLLGGN